MRRPVAILALLVAAAVVRADAIVVTQAMRATTIAEIFVEKDRLRVEFEVGYRDLGVFGAYLPEKLVEDEAARKALRLPADPEPSWRIDADGTELAATRVSSSLAKRVIRDEVTGDPVAEGEEFVVLLSFEYALPARPKTLTLRGPPGAQVGFLLYDEGLPVNDFRYLPPEATVDLDPDDPWYSKFRHRNLHRSFSAPLSAYLYVEPYEIRKEIVLRPRDLQEWVDLGLRDRDVLPIEEQEAVLQKAAVFLRDRAPVLVDGLPAEFALDRIHFIRRSLRRTGVVDPPEELPLASATLGAIFVHARKGTLPRTVTMNWDLFSDRIRSIPAVATDEAGGMPSTLTPEDDQLLWTNFLKNPSATGFVEIPPPGGSGFPFGFTALALAVMGGVMLWRKQWARGAILFVAAGALLFVRPAASDRSEVVAGLLRNTYRAFDFVGESAVYDALQRSVGGEVLQDAYLQTRRALELRNQGGARVKVKSVELTSCDAEPDGDGFRARCAWTVDGSVGHWGHLHQRRNRYVARLTVVPRDGEWRIVGLEMLDEERVE